jgi:hypothetical protein
MPILKFVNFVGAYQPFLQTSNPIAQGTTKKPSNGFWVTYNSILHPSPGLDSSFLQKDSQVRCTLLNISRQTRPVVNFKTQQGSLTI